ncbi:Twinfilin-1 [Myotisia sp. PD_48]|nr:Twinfilin-1 [Myotisia sp. PD_48]
MQSGISVSAELRDAFACFLSNPALFCLPVTITLEHLDPLPPLKFSSNVDAAGDSNGSNDPFYGSLSILTEILVPKTPIYLILRRSPGTTTGLIALTYVPYNSPVRAKMLFASTRATIVRGLGSEKFIESIFATEVEEVIGEEQWREREKDLRAKSGEDGGAREELLDRREKELHDVRRAENAARETWQRKMDIGIGGTVNNDGRSAKSEGQDSSQGQAALLFKVGDAVPRALSGLCEAGTDGSAVILVCVDSILLLDKVLMQVIELAEEIMVTTVDIPTETLQLVETESSILPNALSNLISNSKPQYTLYRHPDSSELMFIYTCPTGSSIKERMFHASSRAGVLAYAAQQGLKVSHRIEASSRDDITSDRLSEEINPAQEESKKAFARPRRPGR